MAILTTEIQSSLQGPHQYELQWVCSAPPSPVKLTATVVVFATNAYREIVLSKHPQRGWQIPGGHVASGKNTMQAAERELMKEAGVLATASETIGYISMKVLGDKPHNYPYPYPIRYCQVFRARIAEERSFEPIADALERGLFSIDNIKSLPGNWGNELLFLDYLD